MAVSSCISHCSGSRGWSRWWDAGWSVHALGHVQQARKGAGVGLKGNAGDLDLVERGVEHLAKMLPSSINATAIASTTTVRERFSVAFAVLFMRILLLFSGTCPAAALPEPAPGTDVNGRTRGAMGTKMGTHCGRVAQCIPISILLGCFQYTISQRFVNRQFTNS